MPLRYDGMVMRIGLLYALVLLASCGCARFAQQTPTPANDLSTAELRALPTPPGERYYIIVFGSQSQPKVPKYTHSWATMVRATDGPAGAAPSLDIQTISWMPATLSIRAVSPRIEPGTNLDLHTTIREMLKHDETIAMWGPYEVPHSNYLRFQVQKKFMESGVVGYQCMDSFGEAARTGLGCDCIHAITDMDPLYDRSRYPLSFFGHGASRHIVTQLMRRGVIVDAPQTHDWLIPPLGLNEYPICRETYRGKVVPNSP